MGGRTVNFFPNIVTYCKANKGGNTGWKHKHQKLAAMEEGRCNLPVYNVQAAAKTGWVGNERCPRWENYFYRTLLSLSVGNVGYIKK